MNLKRTFNKALFGLSIAFFAACGYPSHKLGPEADNLGLRGETKTEAVFGGPHLSNHLYLTSDSLKSKNEYTYNGSVTIFGDIPANTDIDVYNGKLHITGNIGDGAEIEAHVPVTTHQETYTYVTYISTGKTMTPVFHTGTRTVIDGYMFKSDSGPSVSIDGTIGNDVEITTNHDLSVGGKIVTRCQAPAGQTSKFNL